MKKQEAILCANNIIYKVDTKTLTEYIRKKSRLPDFHKRTSVFKEIMTRPLEKLEFYREAEITSLAEDHVNKTETYTKQFNALTSKICDVFQEQTKEHTY